MNELKPCPFCGGKAILWVNQMYPEMRSYIQCMKCGAKTDEFMISTNFSSDDRAAEAWNRRAEE